MQAIRYVFDMRGVDWDEMKRLVAADDFDNGRSPQQLRDSFMNSYAACVAYADERMVGTARVLADGVCNAYLVDVWTTTSHRRRGIARDMVRLLCERLAGQHVYLQADEDVADVYRRIGFREQPVGLSKVIGEWLKA
jgi:predicted GNAT family acetyltransferase